jgi:hypothetical protein
VFPNEDGLDSFNPASSRNPKPPPLGGGVFTEHGPRASNEVTFMPGGQESQTELEQCPSELIGNCYSGIDKEVFQESVFITEGAASMNNERKSSKAGERAAEGLREATAKEEAKNESKTGHDLAKGADRFEERSKSSDGKSAQEKQKE